MWDHSRVSELTVLLLSRGAATIAGLLLVIATTVSLMRTVVIPRALRSVISDTVASSSTWRSRSMPSPPADHPAPPLPRRSR